jgi:Pyridoxamine 5'-phosphate oxidase
MSSSSIRKHAGTGTPSDQPTVPEPSFAERARTLVYLARIGSLSTLSRKQPGFPFGSVMPYGLDDQGRPIFLISTMAMHTQNLQADARASLLVTQDNAGGDPLGASRVTLVGNVLPIPEAEVAEARKLYLARYANSKYWVDFEDFSFRRMDAGPVLCLFFAEIEFSVGTGPHDALWRLIWPALSVGLCRRGMAGCKRNEGAGAIALDARR